MPRKNSRDTAGALTGRKPFAHTAEALGVPLFNEHFKRHFHTEITVSEVAMPGGNNLTIALTCNAFPQITISIQPIYQADKYFLCTDKLAISIMGDLRERIPPIYEYFIRYLCKRLEGVSYDHLLEVVREEEFRFSDSAYLFRTSDLERPFYGWSEQWRSFLCRRALVRNLDSTIQIVNPKIHVGIAEAECHYATLPMSPNLAHFYNYPCVKRKFAETICRDRGYEIELTESDIIMGTRRKLEQMLDRAMQDTDGMDMITINSTCVSFVIGEDYEDIGKAAQRECGLPVFYSSSAINNEMDIFAQMVRRYMKGGNRRPGKSNPSPSAVNFFGFPNTCDVEECLALLQELGVSVNIRFYPVIDFNDLKKIGRASVNVIFPSAYYIGLYSAIFPEATHDVLTPNAPYGLRLTRDWLARISAATGTGKEFDMIWNNTLKEIEDKWTDLRRRAAQCRIGFVLDHFDFTTLLNPKSYWAVEPFSLLEEMGFQMDILFFHGGEHKADFVHRKLQDVLERPERVRVRTFRTPGELDRLLNCVPCQAVFSDYFFDHRLTAAGKAQFSLRDFEMGARGAVRTIERLVRICELPFYRDYSPYLRRGAAG